MDTGISSTQQEAARGEGGRLAIACPTIMSKASIYDLRNPTTTCALVDEGRSVGRSLRVPPQREDLMGTTRSGEREAHGSKT